MRNAILLFFIILVSISPSFSQHSDSLAGIQSALETAKNEKEKASTLLRLAAYNRQKGDLKSAAQAANEALDMAQKNNLEDMLALVYDELGQIYENKYDYVNAIKTYHLALELREKESNPLNSAVSKYHIGKASYLQGDLENAQANLEKAVELLKKGGNQQVFSESNRVLGDIWRTKKIFGKAKEYYSQAIDLKIEANDLNGAAEIAGLLGKLALELGDNEGSLVYFRQSFDLNSSTENLAGMGSDYLNMGTAQQNQQSYDEALSSFQTAQGFFADAKDTLGLAQSLEKQADIYLKSGKNPLAEQSLAQAGLLLRAIKPVPGVPEVFAGIAEGYKTIGNLGQAYQHLALFTSTKEQVFGLEKSKALFELKTRYESEVAAKDFQKTIEQKQFELENAYKIRWALLGILAFAALALWSLLKSNQNRKKANQLLQAKNDEIDAKSKLLAAQNLKLNDLNHKLVGEIANRELLEQTAFNRDQFLSVLSREMRDPLNDILANARDLSDVRSSKQGKNETLQNIQFSANKLLVLVNDLLDYSHIETGKIVLESVEFEPHKIIDDVQKKFIPVFSDKAMTFTVDLDNQIPTKVNGDPMRFKQILTNILSNAAQHSGSGDVRMHLTSGEQNNETFNMKVELNALGALFNDEEIQALSQPNFAAVENVLGERASQTFGLVLAKRLVGLQNGRFVAENIGNEGSSYSILLPFKKIVKKTDEPNKPTLDINAFTGKYILVAEDNKINQLVVTKMLQKAGAVVVPTDDGIAALEAYNNGYFDLILMDIQMPKLDGYRTVAEMRKSLDERKQSTPIIALTASAYLTDKEKAELFQMNDHIGKPFSPEELLEKVAKALTEAR